LRVAFWSGDHVTSQKTIAPDSALTEIMLGEAFLLRKDILEKNADT
jgi:hypothetical protein